MAIKKKRKLSDTYIRNQKPAKSGDRDVTMDTEVSGLGLRVTDTGHKSFILIARYPGSSNPTRRAIGEYPSTTLKAARDKALAWRKLIQQGKDPREEEERARRAELRKRADTFDGVAEEFIKRVLPKQRRGEIVARELRREFRDRWKGRPITSIERRDVIEVINETLDRGAAYQAHNLLGHVRALFNWAIEVGDYGLEVSPCDRIRPKTLIGERKPRQRVLNDGELKAFWKATEGMGYPFGPLFRLLLLTGARKSEVGQARWRELHPELVRLIREHQESKQPIDWHKADSSIKLWTVPPERFKSDAAHLVPLTDDALAILAELPVFTRGDHLFSTTFGERPVTGFAKAKARLDRLMAEALGVELKPFRIHDLRRTLRTRLASLRVADTVAEMVIGHGRRGLQRVYDQHKYEPEMREALELWTGRLRDIVQPAPENVVALTARA